MNSLELSELVYYDPSSPSFLRWVKDRRAGKNHNMVLRPSNSQAGNIDCTGYYTVHLKNKTTGKYQRTPVHRVIWQLFYGEIPEKMVIDHINKNKSDNRIENLRLVTIAENSRNCKKFVRNKSGVTGVSLRVGNKYSDWRAMWVDSEGIKRDKSFSVLKYGFDEAFKLACEYRNKMIEHRNSEGAGYSETHGE